jgi:putative aldouronate transport system substrate-binding protein
MSKYVWRSITSVTTVAMVLLAFIGCERGATEASEREPAGERPALAETWSEFETPRTVKITWFEQGWTGPDASLDLVAPEIARRTNLTLDYEALVVPTGDDYTQRLNLMIASGEVPDVFFGGNDSYTRDIYARLGTSNQIWDLTDIVQDYDHLYELVYPELQLFRAERNRNYFIPTQTGRGNEVLLEAPHGLSVRKDFLDQLGMDFPTTPEELRTYLQRSVAEIRVNGQRVGGLVLGENLGGLHNLYEPFYPLLGLHASYSLPFDPNDNWRVRNYEYTNSPELMAAAKYVHGLVRDGLIDREVLTVRHAQTQAKISSGLWAAATSPWWDMNAFSDVAREQVPDLVYSVTPPIHANETVQRARQREWTNWIGSWSSIIFSRSVEEPAVRHLLALMDYLTTRDGQLLVQAGVEGETWEWNDEGKYEFLPEFIQQTNELDWNRAAAYGVFYYSQLVFNVPAIRDEQATPPSLVREDNRIGWENQQSFRDLYRADMRPPKDYYFVPGEIENQKFPAIVDAKLEFWARVVAATSEAEVERLVNEWAVICRNLGIEDIIAERQAWIDGYQLDG